MDKIKDTVQTLMRGIKVQRQILGESPENCLQETIPAKARGHVKFKDFKNGVIYIHAESSSWLFYLRLQQEQLKKDLQARCPSVKDIRITVGEVK